MNVSKLLLTVALTVACVKSLPLEGAPCPCSPGLVCGKDDKCAAAPDGSSPAADAPPPAPDGSAIETGRADGPVAVDPCAFEPVMVVCGADGLVYGNACDARAAGTTFTSGSQCQSTASCTVYPQMQAVGSCDRVVGWAWDGDGCQPLIGCACTGSGCETLYGTLGACQRGHAMCGNFCRGTTVVCGGEQICVNAGATRCGREDSRGTCTARPKRCPVENQPVCGCDGKTYPGQCAAQMAGADLDHGGACSPSPDAGAPDRMSAPDGGLTPGADPCAAEPVVIGCGADNLVYGNACDARLAGTTFTPGTQCQSTGSCGIYPGMKGVGDCGRLLGWSWSGDGGACLPLIGCACTGSGCHTLYPTLGACERAHYMCKGEFCKADTIVCAPTQACARSGPSRCGRDGSLGYCLARPTSCPPESAPLCGCDGKTYPGQCAARAAGTDIDHPGACD